MQACQVLPVRNIPGIQDLTSYYASPLSLPTYKPVCHLQPHLKHLKNRDKPDFHALTAGQKKRSKKNFPGLNNQIQVVREA
jgi:hypothetical protein